MRTKYTKEELILLTNEEIMALTKGKAVDFHFFNKQPTQLGTNDLQGYDAERGYFYTKTGIEIDQHLVDCIEVIG